MMSTYVKMEQILATLEILADKEALKTIEESKRQVANGEYIECSINDFTKALKFSQPNKACESKTRNY
jgi:hypothetical protein